jgi:hypothetical protein|nr:MAG TPA: putative PadR-family transcriptional regulatory protein [Caudoviricetes sp.]
MMFGKQQVHVLLILWVAKRPLTHEEIEQMAALAKYDDTPQGLRSRMIELERSGHVCRVDREGVNSRHRHCWRFALTDDGREAISELFCETETI